MANTLQWLTFAPVATDSATYYDVSKSTINWISTAFFLAFVAIFPLTIAVLHRGPKLAFMVAAVLILVGNWVRYAGSTSKDGGHIAHVMAGEILIGFAQPFILAAPTRYSDLWFTTRGRVAATAVMSLANPLGGALGQLINPLWVKQPSDISNMVLYVSIIVRLAPFSLPVVRHGNPTLQADANLHSPPSAASRPSSSPPRRRPPSGPRPRPPSSASANPPPSSPAPPSSGSC